jgi:hypothetical protein
MMDWNILLFAVRWAIVALFYFVLLVLLVGVYRETSTRLGKKEKQKSSIYGRLRMIHPGSDPQFRPGSVIQLKATTNLGVAPDNDVVLADPFVSGHHCRLHWDGVNWWLEDLNSKNGTLLNRQPVVPGRPQIIVRGMTITTGDMTMELID